MKTMLMLRAAATLLSVGAGSAHAGDDNGRSAPPMFTSIQARPNPIAAGVPRTSPLFTIGGVAVRVWAPVASPYNPGSAGNLSTRDIWSAG